jgi:quercetin dioxygenase-like cupin family protein
LPEDDAVDNELDGGTPTLLGVRLIEHTRSLSMFAVLAAMPGMLGAQAVVPAHEEPRHRLAFEGPELRVLDIEIPPGDTTLFHRHDVPIAYVFISPTRTNAQVLGESWGSATQNSGPLPEIGNVIFDEAYTAAPLEHRVTSQGNVPFRLIAVMNRGPGQATSGEGSLGSAGPAEVEGRWFRSSHRTLANEGTWILEGHSRPLVIVQVSSGSVSVEPGSGSALHLQALGDFVVLQPGTRADLRNEGAGPATLAIVEVR